MSRSGSAAGFSSDNLSVQVAAPGVNVPAQGRDGQYWLVSGTSPACALTAGVAALIKARYPGLAPALVVQAITSSTQNRPPGGYDNKIGFGTVDAAAALTVAGKLAVQSRSQAGAATTLHFGGGAAAVPGGADRPAGRGRAGRGVPVHGRLSWSRPAWPGAAGGPAAVPVPGASRGGPGAPAGLARSAGPRHLAGPAGPGLSAEQAVGSADREPAGRPGPTPARDRGAQPGRTGSAARLRQPGARRRRLDPARPGHVLRRRGRVPGTGRPPPGRPGHGPVGRQRSRGGGWCTPTGPWCAGTSGPRSSATAPRAPRCARPQPGRRPGWTCAWPAGLARERSRPGAGERPARAR